MAILRTFVVRLYCAREHSLITPFKNMLLVYNMFLHINLKNKNFIPVINTHIKLTIERIEKM